MTRIDVIWEAVLDHEKKLRNTGELEEKRQKQALDWMWALVEEGLMLRFYKNKEVARQLSKVTRAVKSGRTTPTVAASKLLFSLDNDISISI